MSAAAAGPSAPGSAPRFLIVRLGSLGDIVHAIPAAAAVRAAFPDARIDWLVDPRYVSLVQMVTAVSHVVPLDPRAGVIRLLATLGELRRRKYTVAIDLQGLLKSAVLARLSGADRVLGFSPAHLRERMARYFYSDAPDTPGRHVVQKNLALVAALGIDTGLPEFPLDVPRTPAVETVERQFGGAPFALINPGAAWPNKRWPPDRLAAVASALAERHALRSIVLWGPAERELAEAVVAAAGGAALLSPPTTIADLVALARGAAIMVSGDTGPTHIAAAVGTPLVGIYGPTRPERNGPWRPADITVSRADSCECHHLRRCRRETMCLMDIGMAEVLDAVERRLAAEQTRA